MAAHEYPAMMSMIGAGVLQPQRLVGAVRSLEELPGALMSMDNPLPTAGITVVQL
jgi:hypothetical protein